MRTAAPSVSPDCSHVPGGVVGWARSRTPRYARRAPCPVGQAPDELVRASSGRGVDVMAAVWRQRGEQWSGLRLDGEGSCRTGRGHRRGGRTTEDHRRQPAVLFLSRGARRGGREGGNPPVYTDARDRCLRGSTSRRGVVGSGRSGANPDGVSCEGHGRAGGVERVQRACSRLLRSEASAGHGVSALRPLQTRRVPRAMPSHGCPGSAERIGDGLAGVGEVRDGCRAGRVEGLWLWGESARRPGPSRRSTASR